MNKNIVLIMLTLTLLIFISDATYAMKDKTILILLDELNLDDVEGILSDTKYGIGFMNLKTRQPYSPESLYFSIGMGKKVGANPCCYKGLYKDRDGTINIAGFKEMMASLSNCNDTRTMILASKLKDRGISYIGDNSSAIVGADNDGRIGSGEIEVKYDEKWLIEKTKEHLSNNNILILSYNAEKNKKRLDLLGNFIDQFRDLRLMILPTNVFQNIRYIVNGNLVPIIYTDRDTVGIIQSLSTRRKGFISLEDISVELLFNNGEKDAQAIGNRIDILEESHNIPHAKNIFKKSINLMIIAYLFHGIVCLAQACSAYFMYRNRKEKFSVINSYNNLIIVNIFISLLMGISNLHVNVALYLFINLLATYIITVFILSVKVDAIGLFSTLTYILINYGILFRPEILYNSHIGFNNLFYGFRYYGLNNGIMGVLLVSSIISYFFIRKLISNKSIDKIVCFFYFMMNIIVLSANYGANTGGFATAIVLFLIMIYIYILEKRFNMKSIFALASIGILIFVINMYFDYFSDEKSHAINFLIRIRTFGISEFLNMFKVKARELIKLTIIPPLGIAIMSQVYCLTRLLGEDDNIPIKKINIMLLIGVIAFILNDTGIFAFIYIMHYLISLLFYYKTRLYFKS